MTLRFVLRTLQKRPFLNVIKIAGLSLALSCILLIVLFLKYELSFDRFHEKSHQIYRLTITSPTFLAGKHFARIPNSSNIPAMSDYFPEIEEYVRLVPVRGGVMKYKDEFFNLQQAFVCDSTFFDLFDADLLVGNRETILEGPGSLVLAEGLANKVFGNDNPIGQVLTIPAGQFYGEEINYVVKGIMKDFPRNSHFHPEFISTPMNVTAFNGWSFTYLKLHANADPEKISAGFRKFAASVSDTPIEDITTVAHLQKISDIHLHSGKTREIEANSNMTVVWSFTIAALILLIIALINYANLNMGMAGFSDRYLFVSKVAGSSNRMQLKFFLTESVIIFMGSILFSGIIATLVLKYLHNQASLDLVRGNIPVILAVVILFTMMGALAGIVPLLRRYKRKRISKSLIVLQYTISIALIVAVFVIHRQTSYALNSSLGVEDQDLVCMDYVHADVQQKFGEFKEELLKYNSISSVSAMLEAPGEDANDMFRFELEGYLSGDDEEVERIGVFPCDYSLPAIFNLNFLAGTSFSERSVDVEGSGEYIINKSALEQLNYSDPGEIIGKEFALIVNFEGISIPRGRIIGVVEDFHLSSLKKKIEALVMFKRKSIWLSNFIISFQPGMKTQALADIESVWTKMYPGYQLEYDYVSSMYRDVYSTELLQARLLSIFTFIALFICSMGLLGMSLLTTQRRIKEIGIRRVNGAGTGQLMAMLNWDFLKWIVLSIALATPLAYFGMSRWMENFAYKVGLSWWIFALAGFTALLIALITVSVQSWRASTRNPVEALRYE